MSGIAVVGAGAWGTALAHMLASGPRPQEIREILVWALEPELVEDINLRHRNSLYLPGTALSPAIRATNAITEAAACDIVLMVTPAQHMGRVLAGFPRFPRDLVLCSKGIEADTGRMMSQVAADAAPGSEIAVLSGPTFAHEVAAGLPTAVTLACGGGAGQWERLCGAIARPAFRPYYSNDVTGAQVGGAVKNVLAIACGVVEGLGMGHNARAALIARGFAEMLRFGEALGGRRETLAGLCGLGDLVLTCSSSASRNFALGKALGEGRPPRELIASRSTVAEGAHTAPVLVRMAAGLGIDMPICEAVNRLLGGAPVKDVVTALLTRPLRAEDAGT